MNLYSEIILDYYKNPRNKEILKNPDTQATEHNPSCGDSISIYLKLDKNNKVEKATFTGEGCAISQAATSMLTEELIGKTPKQIQSITPEDIYEILGVQIGPGRIKCALLGLQTAQKAVTEL